MFLLKLEIYRHSRELLLHDCMSLCASAVIRLGKREEGRNRLLKVVVDSVKSKRRVLQGAKKLHDNTTWSNIYITPDHTPKERQTYKDLREELRRRTENGEQRLVIRRGKITTIPAKGEDNQEQVNGSTSSQQLFR